MARGRQIYGLNAKLKKNSQTQIQQILHRDIYTVTVIKIKVLYGRTKGVSVTQIIRTTIMGYTIGNKNKNKNTRNFTLKIIITPLKPKKTGTVLFLYDIKTIVEN